MDRASWNLLILSDLHLGEQEPGEDRGRVQQRAEILGHHFGAFLDHYRAHRENNLPWRLVLAGDTIDFMRIHVPQETTEAWERVAHQPSSHVAAALWHLPPHDLRGTLQKLDQLVALHHKTFLHLVRFLAAGNEVVLITGNHDAELDWLEVQERLLQHLQDIARRDRASITPDELADRLRFAPRFYYEPERVYIEHGHFYDSYCNVEEGGWNPTTPAQKTDNIQLNRRLSSLSHALNFHQFSNPQAFDSLPLHHIDQWGAIEMLQWFLQRPLRQKILLASEFVMMTLRLVLMAWSYSFRRILNLPKSEHRRAIQQWSRDHNLPVEAVEPLQKFVTAPLHTKFFDTLQALYIDRMALILATAFGMTVIFVSPWSSEAKAALATGVATLFVGTFLYLSHRRPVSETIPLLFGAAVKISGYLQTPLVVMAHSHHYEQRELRDGQLYVNCGAWTVPDTMIAPMPEPDATSALPQTPAVPMSGVPEFETFYLQITTTTPPHRFKLGTWSYHGGPSALHTPHPVTESPEPAPVSRDQKPSPMLATTLSRN